MNKVIVSDSAANASRVAYIYNALSARLPAGYPFPAVSFGDRAVLTAEEKYAPVYFRLAGESIAESIAVGLKYRVLSAALPLPRLSAAQRELFLYALISADLPLDKKYVTAGLKGMDTVALDGFYTFRLGELKRKWEKIVSCVPDDFSGEELKRFMLYLVEDNASRVYVEEGRVYDEKYRLLRLGSLVGAKGESRTVAEILLSGAKEVCVRTDEGNLVMEFLKNYYAGRTVFYGKKEKNS